MKQYILLGMVSLLFSLLSIFAFFRLGTFSGIAILLIAYSLVALELFFERMWIRINKSEEKSDQQQSLI